MYKLKTKAKSHWSVPERHLVRAAIDFAVEELDLLVNPVPIDIILKGEHETDFGDSIDLEYKVVVRIFKSPNWLRTLFHELEHVRQYVYCELELEVDHAMWQGELATRNIDNWDEYWNAPWEVAAREKEAELLVAFQKNLLTISS